MIYESLANAGGTKINKEYIGQSMWLINNICKGYAEDLTENDFKRALLAVKSVITNCNDSSMSDMLWIIAHISGNASDERINEIF